ncbi:transporter substrate-binding domain-containing protein [Colwellia sp. MB3u-70]|uniref:substrate-binding periplasmic protein n=1 Tax=unclassified Colwellia TaxID=196834 RepID=UPI0015F43D0B|nr:MULTISPECIES: transporter substrate-binding domain-containing protein [unclassified Colwellia]MBA6293147.1 transporter substrate-binding domain-containing protein [Colwellia sp. MB3u-8]MBA6307081.1 transporter substrate-binding domain-containing protein [Colwellia sp. MB3u-70]
MLDKKIYNLLFLLLISNANIRAETLNIASDIWCPYICDNKKAPGILVEALNEIAKAKKMTVNIEIISLSRSLIMASKSEIDIVLAVTKSHITDHKLQSSHQYFGGWQNDFYISRKVDWSPNKLNDLDAFLNSGKTLGIIKGYDYGPYINSLKFKYADHIFQATGDSPLTKNIEMLQKGRISALLDSRYNIQYEMNKNNIVDLIYARSEGGFVPLFLGYSPTILPEVINSIDDGLTLIRHKGILSTILEKYGVSDWQKKI